MARNYPRFLFSNVTTGKSTGAFITHTLKPQMLIAVTDTDGYLSGLDLTCVALWDTSATNAEDLKVIDDAKRWLIGKIKNGEITL